MKTPSVSDPPVLADATEQWRAMFDLVPDGVMLVDPQTTRAVRFNEAAHRQLGYDAEEFAALAVADYEAQHTLAEIGDNVRKLHAGERLDFESRHRRKDGSLIDVSVSIVATHIGGRPWFLSVVRDITELGRMRQVLEQRADALDHALRLQQAAQGALVAEHDFTLGLLETVPVIIVVFDPAANIEYINPHFEELSGWTLAEVKGRNWFDTFVPPEQREERRQRLGESQQGAPRRRYANEIILRDGRRRRVEWYDQFVRDAAGQLKSMLFAGQDVTERQRMEDQLRRQADQLNAAQRIAQLGSWELDLVANRLEWSDEIFRLFELDPTKFGATYEAFLHAIHPDDREAVNRAYTRSLETRKPYEIVHRLRMADGRIKWVHERCTSDFDAAGKPLRSVGTVQDITEQRQLELDLEQVNRELEDRIQARTAELETAKEEAERANQAKTEFLSRMSHELRTPMNAILGFGQLLQSDETHPLLPAQREGVDEILRAGRHLMELINEILDLARVESGKLDVSLEAVELAPLVQEGLTLIRPLAAQRQLRLESRVEACLVRADRLRLRQVLLNLLSNAVKYNRDGGEVRVRCKAGTGGRARIEVSDSGMGIAPDSLARLFRPFERLESAYKGIEGTGIGLALTKRLVQAMGGEVGVRSVPGEGSTFWVELPVASEAGPAPAGPATVPPAPARRPLVLCIEDNPLNLRVMVQVFALRPGYELLTARSAEEGIDLARQRLPALILLDINLPGMDGYQALGVLKADVATASIPVVAVSANAMLGDRERGLASGFLSYVTKPIDVPRLLELLDRLLADEPAGNVNKEMP